MTTATITRHATQQIQPKSRYNNTRRKAIREGTWERNRPADEVRAHIDALRKGPARLRLEDIAERSGVPYGTVTNILYCGAETVTGWVATRILALTADEPADRKYIDATGTRRRLEALAWMQWGQPHIAARLGICERATAKLVYRPFVHETTAARVRQVFDQLSGTLGPSPRARLRAKRLGFHGPLAWEGVDIDDPNAEPIVEPGVSDEPEGFDPVIVGFAVDGRLTYEQIKHNRADVVETVRRLAQRMNDAEIALHLRWPGAEDGPAGRTRGQGAVCQLRVRNGIPNHNAREVIAPTRARDRARAARRQARQAA